MAKSTILHYVNEGLLPQPIKTSPNMAYYHPDCVERVRFVKAVQQDHPLSLPKIRRLLERRDQGDDLTPQLDLIRGVFGEPDGDLLGKTAFCKATGLTRQQVDDLIDANLLLPLNPGHFDAQDVAIGNVFAGGLARGLRVEDAAFYAELGKKIVDEEMAVRRRLTHHLSHEEDASLTLRMVHSARAMRGYVIDRLFQLRIAAAESLKGEELLS